MDDNYKSSGQTYDQKTYGHYFGLTPSFLVETKYNNLRPYAKFGFIVALPGATGEQSTSAGTNKAEYSGGIALGYVGAAGLKFGTDKLQFFAELGLTSLSWAPSKVKYTDGSSGQSKEYDLKDETPPSSSTNSARLQQMVPFSNIALNVGVKLEF